MITSAMIATADTRLLISRRSQVRRSSCIPRGSIVIARSVLDGHRDWAVFAQHGDERRRVGTLVAEVQLRLAHAQTIHVDPIQPLRQVRATNERPWCRTRSVWLKEGD